MIIPIRRTLFIEDTFILEQWTVQYDGGKNILTSASLSQLYKNLTLERI